MNKDIYEKLNLSYRKRLLYKWGAEAGFYSEINNLILAMGYCLENHIQLVIYSPKKCINSIDKGWEDFFLKFCPIILNSNKILDFLINKFDFRQSVGIKKYKLVLSKVIKKILGFDYFTFELFNNFRNAIYICGEHNLPEISYNKLGLDYYSDLIKIAYTFQEDLNRRIKIFIDNMNLPKTYIGMHIRGGDKIQEYELIKYNNYFELLQKQNNNILNIFIFTDDYDIFEKCTKQYKKYNIITSCKKNEKGYRLSELAKLDRDSFIEEYIKMIASIEILRKASMTIGTYTTNPGMFLGMIMNHENNFIDVQNNKWSVT